MVVVMGGGVLADGTLPPHVVPRCEAVLAMTALPAHAVVVASSSFSLNTPPKLTRTGLPVSEASAIARWLKAHGFTGTIACEQQSHDTVGSVFFVLALHATFLGASRVLFVTSAFHAERTARISEFVNERVFGSRFEVRTMSVPDVGVTQDRVLHEAQSLEKFRRMFGGVPDAASFVHRLFLEHGNYNDRFGSDAPVSGNLLY
jgi:uncharacterized SAM-binding protein YcdF (DUF218 family)